MKRNLLITALLSLLILMLIGGPVLAASFPSKTVTVICPWSAGGGTDTILRGLAKQTEPFLGQNITVVNKTGGGGAIGHGAGIHARPDGYTVTMVTFEIISLPPQGLVPFTYKDYDLLMRVNMDPAAITVPKDAPYNNIAEFVAYAKAHPGEIKVGHSGPGSVWQIAGGIFAEKAGIDLTFVPHDGAAPAVTALVGKHIQAVSVSPAEVQGQVEAGSLKMLAVMSDSRLPNFPDVPTMKEAGYDVSFGTWRGLAVPKGTPAEVKKVLHDAFKQGMESEAFLKFAKDSGLGLAYLPADAWDKDLEVASTNVANTMKKLGLAK
ncbi:tripartite tricarboxylate transporter substrate binding protein [Pelobacter seleniigenes]|uniref:tripartite tricarboxylate transporter substrate binding protein n=1 Tax=Pelobacter seleniigenes TaxID=407188 RepID=UPI0004A6C2D2|nr:tripartite tricarboxylate transporter substrate binding protein [Pelobacter seleniigenes]